MINRFRIVLGFVLLIFAVPLLSGCFALLAGSAIGYELSADSVKADFDCSYKKAYKVSLDVVKAMVSKTDIADETSGWIKFSSENNNVAIHIVKQTDKTVEIMISARKYATPRVQFAKDILIKISKKIN